MPFVAPEMIEQKRTRTPRKKRAAAVAIPRFGAKSAGSKLQRRATIQNDTGDMQLARSASLGCRPQSELPSGLRVVVLYGSQTGTSAKLARRLVEAAGPGSELATLNEASSKKTFKRLVKARDPSTLHSPD